MSRTTYGMVDANALSGFEIVCGMFLWLVEILYYKSLLSLNITMVSVPSVAVTGLLKVKLNAVSVGTSMINDTEPNALERPELVMK